MNSVLSRYLTMLLLKRSLATVLILTALLQIVDLFDTSTEILHRGLGVAGILKYEMLRAPVMIQQILPVSVLIGALMTFTGLAKNSEMAALRSTGITIYRIILMLLPAAALMALLLFVIGDQIAPRASQAFSVWWKATTPAEEQAKPAKAHQVWFRTQGYLVYAEAAAADGRRLEGLRIYRREQGRLAERVTAAAAVMGDDDVWRLSGVSAVEVSPDQVSEPTTTNRVWNTELSPADVVAVFSPEDSISSARAWRAITGERPADKSPAFYTTRVQRALAEPLAVFVMLLLASPAALAQQRNNQTVLLLFSLGAGLLFLMVDGVLTALGQTNVLPPLLGAWAGPALFAALAGAALVHLEG
jgi:lipopolysaccharide export system permease protein